MVPTRQAMKRLQFQRQAQPSEPHGNQQPEVWLAQMFITSEVLNHSVIVL